MSESLSAASKDEIVVYQPNNTLRLEVRVIGESVWLSQMQLCELFGVVKSNISYHLKNIFETGELEKDRTVQKIRTVQYEGGRSVSRFTDFFNLEVVISLGFRINSRLGIQFRRWANDVLRQYMAYGIVVSNPQTNALVGEMNHRLAVHDRRLEALEEKVDYFIQSSLPPKERVMRDGQMLDAQADARERVLPSAGARS